MTSSVRRSALRWGVLATAGGLLFLAGCSSDDSGSAGGGESVSSGQIGRVAPGSSDGGAAPADSGADPSGTVTAPGVPDLPRALIRTADVTVVVDDVPAAARSAQDYARAAGGATAGDNRSGTGTNARADLVLQVAPGQLDATMDRFGGLGREVSRSSTTQDATSDVADIDVRVKSMQASIARVRAILAQATRIGDVVSVEGELSRRTTELESLQARQRALAGQTSLATVTLHLIAKDAPYVPPAADRGGFLGGLEDGWNAFTTGIGWLATALGAVLPFLIVLVPLALAVRWWLRRQRPVVVAATAATAGPAATPGPAAAPAPAAPRG